VQNFRNRLFAIPVRHPYIDLPNFVDHLTRKPYAYTTRCKCKITRFNLASRETGIKRFRAWTHHWAERHGADSGGEAHGVEDDRGADFADREIDKERTKNTHAKFKTLFWHNFYFKLWHFTFVELRKETVHWNRLQ
jgi:hypothetical protein